MSTEYELVNDIDLTLGSSDIADNNDHLQPSQAMQDNFIKNCVELGILREKTTT